MDGPGPTKTVAVSPGVEIDVLRAPREDGSCVTAYSLVADGDHLSPKATILLLHGSGSNSVFLGIPSLDRCEGADLAVAEFVRHDKTNLTYRNYANYDHGFFEHIRGRSECRHALVLADILQWVRMTEEAILCET